MTILRKKLIKKGKGTTLLGAYVPKDISDYFSIFCISHKRTKSNVLNLILENWMDKQQTAGLKIPFLLDNIVATSYSIYKNDDAYLELPFGSFFNDFVEEIMKHPVLKDYKEELTDKMYEYHEEKNKAKNG